MANIFYVKAQGGVTDLLFMRKSLVPGCKLQFFLKMDINKTGASQCTSEFYKNIIKLSKDNFEGALMTCQTWH